MGHVLRQQRYLTCSVYGLRLSYDPKVDRVNMCIDIRSCAECALTGVEKQIFNGIGLYCIWAALVI